MRTKSSQKVAAPCACAVAGVYASFCILDDIVLRTGQAILIELDHSPQHSFDAIELKRPRVDDRKTSAHTPHTNSEQIGKR
eukprot:6477457-Amphidinium_carterae.1